mmetsp:Transcript_73337/g.184852  ORF Transcript_73337/g.184852 Transcript_73337/m.184852 type:complete len:498 (+) Transcript_73337:73-1566(+)|eukprot:CAMPEP_0115245066 /NCGR_PEP_ID=MMETSP0270-20121206/40316_1 /TAXON_ID=71861 /ORGANISM="Scrippsiella trochoidea, Strain CCMP3099" /LENGTH=497 /DNA_ID=CAMNT_0002660231 /DNA_START=68 /DNA_END=1561 /DNA_ORIENTATION=+
MEDKASAETYGVPGELEGEPKAEATKAASSDSKPVLEPGVCGCFSVVSGAVRKGKGRGKGKSNANGGYVPAHLRDPLAEAAAEEALQEASEEAAGDATGSADATTGIAEATSADTSTTAPDAEAAATAAVATGLSRGASFDSLGLSTSGSFDAETGEGGTSIRKRAKRWQRRGSSSATDVTAAAAAGSVAAAPASEAAKPAEVAEPAAKRPKASPPGSPADTPSTTDVQAQDASVKNEAPDFGDFPMASPSPVADDAGMPPPSPAVDAFPPPSPFPQGPTTLAKLSVGKLKSLARYHGVNIAGCLEKAEMVAALRKANVDDAAAEKMEERARGGAAGESQAAPKDTKTPQERENERKAAEHAQKRVAAKVSEAEQRAAAAEAEAKKLRDELNATKTSSKKKWAPAFASTPFIAGQESKESDMGMPPRSPMGGHFGGPGSAGKGAPRAPTGGVDLRNIGGGGGGGGKGGQKGGPGFDICWEFKKGMCTKGLACKWKHG